jgi:hypothetical protein
MYAVHGIIRGLYFAGAAHGLAVHERPEKSGVTGDSPLALQAARVADRSALRYADSDNGLWHFGFVLDDKALSGSLPVAGFQEGDKIMAVVSDPGGAVLDVHAVVRIKDALLWMPYYADKGRYASLLGRVKSMLFASASMMVLIALFLYFGDMLAGFSETMAIFAGAFALIGGIVVALSYFSSPEGEYAEQIMKVLGFKRPASVNLARFSQHALRPKQSSSLSSYHVYDLLAALKHYDSLPAGHPARKK